MEIIQNFTKNNQPIPSGDGKVRGNAQTQSDGPSFEQILQKLTICEPILDATEQLIGTSPPAKSCADCNYIDSEGPSEQELEILFSWFPEVIQQMPLPRISLENPDPNLSSEVDNGLQPDSNQVNLPLQISEDVMESLPKLARNMEGDSQITIVEGNPLFEQLYPFSSQLKTQPSQSTESLLMIVESMLQGVNQEIGTKAQTQEKSMPNGDSQPSIVNGHQVTAAFEKYINHLNQEENPELQPLLERMQLLVEKLNSRIVEQPNGDRQHLLGTHSKPLPKFEINQMLYSVDSIPSATTEVMGGLKSSSASASPPIITVGQFIPEVNQLVGNYMKITNGQSGSTEAKFLLTPENLGRMEVRISTLEGQVSVQIVTETVIAKDALDGQLQQLKQALQQQGLVIQKVDVVQSPIVPEMTGSFSFTQGGSSNHSFKEQQNSTPSQDGSNSQQESNQPETSHESNMHPYGVSPSNRSSMIDFTA